MKFSTQYYFLTNYILLIFIIMSSFIIQNTNSSNILFLYPIAAKSETHLFISLAKALAARGHSITIVSPVYTPNLTNSNIHQIIATTPFELSDLTSRSPLEERQANQHNKYQYLIGCDVQFEFDRCHAVYQHQEFSKLYEGDSKASFDLIIISGLAQHCLDGVLYKLGAPFIFLSSMPVVPWTLSIATGFHPPPSFVPISFIENEDTMSFGDRFGNTVFTWFSLFISYYVVMPQMDAIGRKYLGDGIPDGVEIERNVSMIFSHGHYAITFPRPTLPDVIEIGGIHCSPPQKLPGDLEKFMDDAKDSVILFSLGSVVQAHTLPEETIKIFLNVFSRLKQRVLWKWEKESMEGLPSNVKLSKWLPQQDVLGHPNLKLFISHGGLLSTMESIYHGVPILGIPIYIDQDTNMRSLQRNGYSLTIEILNLTEAELESKIHQMLNDKRFSQAVKEISEEFRSQIQSPMDRAIYWSEYVIKHKGAPHLKSGARGLNFWQYHSVDILLALGALIISILAVILYLIKKLRSYIFGFGFLRRENKYQVINNTIEKKFR